MRLSFLQRAIPCQNSFHHLVGIRLNPASRINLSPRFIARSFPKDRQLYSTNSKPDAEIYGSSSTAASPATAKEPGVSQKLWEVAYKIKDLEALNKLGKALNELTGYDTIEKAKEAVLSKNNDFEAARHSLHYAKNHYESCIETRSRTQRDISELLQRKHLWNENDVNRFTELYRFEHVHAQEELAAKGQYEMAEKHMDREYMQLTRTIMERYHEEQVWSDKIRSASTYGTWALMVLNIILFVMVQTMFEPMKRKKLTNQFEELLVRKVEEEEGKFLPVFEEFFGARGLLTQMQSQKETSNITENLGATLNSSEISLSQPLNPYADGVAATDIYPTKIIDSDQPQSVVLSDTILLKKRDAILYGSGIALAGGAITALAGYLWWQ